MRWRIGGAAALVAGVLIVALFHPDAGTAVLQVALLVAAAVAAASRIARGDRRPALVTLAVGVSLHATTAVLRQGRLLDSAGHGATALGYVHAGSLALSVVSLLVLGLRATRGTTSPVIPAAARDVELERELRQAVADADLSVHYQPIVSAGTGQIASVEALVRWNHPRAGLLTPAQFLPVAEAAGLMVDIGRHVLAVASADLAAWRSRWPDLALAVNVSERELLHPGFADHVIETLRRHRLPAGVLHLELTETVTVNEDTIANVLEPLASYGVALSIDDFGTGHSTLQRLNRLRRLQVQRLKIDKSFVDELGTAGQGAGPLLASMIALAHSVGHSVVAEGVETDHQAEFLTQHGCDELQGFLYSRPVPAERVTAMLAAAQGHPAPADPGLTPQSCDWTPARS